MGSTILLTGVVLLVLAAITYFLYSSRAKDKREFIREDKITLESLLEYVKKEVAEATRDDTFIGRDDEEYATALNRKERFQESLMNSSFGMRKDKVVIKRAIASILTKKLPTEEDVLSVIDFNGHFLDPGIKWEILVQQLRRKHKDDTLTYLIHQYHLDSVKYDTEKGESPMFRITIDDLNYIYNEELGFDFELDYQGMIRCLATLIWIRWLGYGCIDTLREMNIDGINGGVSGSILYEQLKHGDTVAKAPRSVWIYFEGKRIFLEFLSFGSEQELARVCKMLIRFGKQGQIVDRHPYVVTSMEDRARLVVFRPTMSEYWAFVIRKFVLKTITLESLMDKKDSEGNSIIDNVQDAIYLLSILIKSMFSPIVTGRQGSGKTTALIAMMYYVDSRLSLRTLEMTFELFLREQYPDRNILSLMETPYVTLMEGQDALKKADSDVLIVGEIAQDKVALNFIQAHHTYMQTFATHHGASAEEMVNSLADSAMRASGSNDINAMKRDVSKAVDFDFHYDYDKDGFRFLDRITEIIPVDSFFEYSDIDPKHLQLSMARLQREYYIKSTDQRDFVCNDIMIYDKENRHYVFKNFLSDKRTKQILDRLDSDSRTEFLQFVRRIWGGA